MSTTAYQNFIEKTVRKVIILAEIEPREAVDEWTVRTGSIYQHPWETFTQADLVPGGLYREILSVEEDGVELTRVTNQLDLITPGTWFFAPITDGEAFKLGDKLGDKLGATTETLMVHTTDSTSPTTKTVMRVTFRIYLSTVGVVHNAVYYEPRLTGEQLPTIAQESEDLFFGIAKKVANGSLSLNNADALFDKLAAQWVWRNARVNLYIGGDDLEHQAGGGLDYVSIGQMLVENFVPTQQTALLNVRDIHKVTLRQLPPNFFSAAIYPQLQSNAEGKPIPLLFGSMSSTTGALVPTRISGDGTNTVDNIYVIADAALQSLYSIDEVYNDFDNFLAPTAVGSTFVQTSLTGCTFAIMAGLSDTLGSITVNAVGQPVLDQALAPWQSSTDYLKGYGEIVSHFYTQVLGLTNSEIDSACAVASDTVESAPQAFHLTTQKAARVLIRDLERGVLGRTIRNSAGVLCPTIWEPGVDASNTQTIEDQDVMHFEPKRRIESVHSRVYVSYLNVPATGASKVTHSDNVRTKRLYLDDRDDELVLNTLLTTGVAARRLADRVAFMTQQPDATVRVVETGIRLMDRVVGDRIYLTLARAPSEDGVWDGRIFEIQKIIKRFAPVPQVEVTLNDLRGIGGIVGVWTSNLTPDYASASSSEKSVSGFFLDADELADPTDLGSRNVSVWW